jgi:uracil-DNA glycosylase
MQKTLDELMEPGWAKALAPVADDVAKMGEFLRAEVAAGRTYLPAAEHILRAFQQPFDDVKVIIVGQDPYPTPGHAIGLSFAVAPDVRPLPKSLVNIFNEYRDDLGFPLPANGDLTPWAEQGVLLLNRSLSVAPGSPASHRGKGWESVTEQAIRALAERHRSTASQAGAVKGGAAVAILWGADARKLKDLLGPIPSIESAHPSPLSARRGFFGSKPFSRANQLLVEQGGEPVDWRLPALGES